MKKRTLAIAASVAALSFVAAPIAGAATASASTVKSYRLERVHDARADRTGHDRWVDTARSDRTHEPSSPDKALDR